jgi:high-affinity iron transporter
MILKSPRLRSALPLLGLLLAVPVAARPQDDPTALARRIAAASAIAADEYALGTAAGRVVSEAELEEARLFLTEARRLADRLPESVRRSVARDLDALIDAAAALALPEVLADSVNALRLRLAAGLGIALDPLPAAPASLARGAEVYARTCSSCHGPRGDGRGAAALGLDPPPADFTDQAALRSSSPLDFFRKVTVGIAGTAMPAYEHTLSLEERWAVALYASGLRYAAAAGAPGRRWVTARCPDCLVDLSDGIAMLAATDDSLEALIAGRTDAAVPPEALAFARTAGAADVLGADPALAARRAVSRAEALVAEAVSLALAGDAEAARGRSLDAYLAFEAIETRVGARSSRAVSAVERAFGNLRGALAGGDSARIAVAQVNVRRTLGAAAEAVTEVGVPTVLFGQSLVIIVREGLEAILIIGALIAFLVRAGAGARVRDIGYGAALAVVASGVTAALFATVVRVSVAQQEALEGLTMLLASVVLFGVASWMVSKVEAERWQAFVRARMQEALGSGKALALGGVAFLAVYREGVETILFYAALFGTADTAPGAAAVWAGLVVGALVLAGVYVAMRRWGVRIPFRPFFAVTGALLTIMAVSFAGQGVAELQAAGWVPATPIRLPTLPALGMFPTVQTALAQAAMALAFVVALVWIFLRVRPEPSAR